jgi:hypothetical protein
MANPRFLEVSPGMLDDPAPVPVAGILGYDLFRRSVVELDLANDAVSLHDPAAHHLDAGSWEPLVLPGALPALACRLPFDREEFFVLDSGAGPNLVLNPWLARELDVPPPDGTTAGNDIYAQCRMGSLTVAGRRVRLGWAFQPREERTVTADRSLGGVLGRRLMQEFRIVLDYGRERIAFLKPIS